MNDCAVNQEGGPHLRLRDIHFSYGAVKVLFGIDLEVPRGGRVALLGTNGAGKSTVLKVAAGVLQPDRGCGGVVHFAGHDVTAEAPEQHARRGMILVSGGRSTFPSLTVEENLKVGAYPFLGDHDLVASRIEEVLTRFPMLRERSKQRAGTLSGGEQQMMALGRAMVAEPELLMIDELSLGLAPVIMGEILHMIADFAERRTTLLIVEQSLNVAAALTDHAYFLEKGEVRFSGPTDELLDRGEIARSVFFGARS